MRFKTTTVFLFLFLLSCTVTKRVHRPGFHVEWKKNYKVQKDEARESDNSASLSTPNNSEKVIQLPRVVESDSDLKVRDTVLSTLSGVERYQSTNLSVPGNSKDTVQRVKHTEQHCIELVEMSRSVQLNRKHQKSLGLKRHTGSFFIQETRKYAPLKMPEVEESSSSRSNAFVSDGFRGIGYVLLGISAFLLLGVLMTYLGIWLLEEIFYSLVFSGNGIIAGILGFILFLIIVLVAFIAYAVVHYILGGAYIGLIVSMIFLGAGLLCLLIGMSLE